MIPLSFQQNFDLSFLSTMEAGFWTIPSASVVFALKVVPVTGSIVGHIALPVILTVVNDDHSHLTCSRGESIETCGQSTSKVVYSLQPRPRRKLTALQTTTNAQHTEIDTWQYCR